MVSKAWKSVRKETITKSFHISGLPRVAEPYAASEKGCSTRNKGIYKNNIILSFTTRNFFLN